jgi:tripartite-type tricarboxylate transporter receptor subunit TctC
VQLIITSPPSVMSFVKQGRVKALALTTAKASPIVPGIPGAEEAGLKNFNLDGWYALYGPANLPPAITNKLHQALNAALAQPPIKEKLEGQGAQPDPSPSVEHFVKFGIEDRARNATIVRDSGARVE